MSSNIIVMIGSSSEILQNSVTQMYFHETNFCYSSDSLTKYLDNDDYLPVEPRNNTVSLHSIHGFVSAKKNRCAGCIFFTVAISLLLCLFFCFVLSVFVQACQLLLQQQQPQQQQQQLLQNQRKFTPNVRQQADPQQVRTNTTYHSVLCHFFTSSFQLLTLCFLLPLLSWLGSWRCSSSRGSSSRSGV